MPFEGTDRRLYKTQKPWQQTNGLRSVKVSADTLGQRNEKKSVVIYIAKIKPITLNFEQRCWQRVVGNSKRKAHDNGNRVSNTPVNQENDEDLEHEGKHKKILQVSTSRQRKHSLVIWDTMQ